MRPNSVVLSLFVATIFVGVAPVFAQTETSDKVVVLHTQSGDMVIELFPNDAPKTVANFLNLTEHKFYDRTVFHRVIKDFMIQGGDPKTKPGGYQHLSEWGTGNAGYTIPGEFNTIKHKRGIVSMARSQDPDSGSSQFFIVHKDSFHLDQNYAVFGRLATQTSFDTLDKIANLENEGEPTNYVPYDWGQGEILTAEVKKRSEIKDLLKQGELERVTTITNQTSQPYTNEKLGFSFEAPAGWIVQEPQKRSADTPDVVAVGDKIGGTSPAISISIKKAGGASLDEYSDYGRKILQIAIDKKILEIQNEEKTTIGGTEAFVRDATGTFNVTGNIIKVQFREVTIKNSDNFYVLTYTNSQNNFEKNLEKFNTAVNSFKINSEPKSIIDFYNSTQIKQSELQKTLDDALKENKGNKATLLIFSDTEWSGSILDSGKTSSAKQGSFHAQFDFDCSDNGSYSLSIQKQASQGYLQLYVVQNGKILDDGSTSADHGTVSLAGQCNSSAVGGNGCLIATAAYGSELAPQVQMLRELRDSSIRSTGVGTAFVAGFNEFYYTFSPTVADWERQSPAFKEMVRLTITPMLSTLSILNHVDIDSEQEMLGYGVGVILLNLGMYFVAPAIIIIKTKNRLAKIIART